MLSMRTFFGLIYLATDKHCVLKLYRQAMLFDRS